ncbi:MAG: T9SS type A sorting domain-containing protein [Bacteroidota bacterium]
MKSRNKRMRRSIRGSQKQIITTKQIMLFASAGILIPAILLTLLNITKHEDAYGSSNGDYRSKTPGGNWSSTATWQKMVNGSWVNAPSAPTSADGVITILSGHTVVIDGSYTADQVVIASGGQATINSGTTFTLANNASGADLIVSGTLKNAGTITLAASASISYSSGGKYQHNFTSSAGKIPSATWNSGSTCEIIGYTSNSSAPTGLGQSFENFTWNCAAQSQDINLNGALTTVNGDLTFNSTSNKELRLTGSNYTINVGGDLIQTGGSLSLSDQNSATVNFNLGGNWTRSGGTFTSKNGSTNIVTFNGGGNSQIFTESGSIPNTIDFKVVSGSKLLMGTNVMTGKSFNLNSGAILCIGSTAGISSLLGGGNIQTSSRTFSSGANYIYAGTAAQVTGSGLPSSVNGLEINNSAGLTTSGNVDVTGTLTLTSGCITPGLLTSIQVSNRSSSAVTGHSSNSYIKGSLRRYVSTSGTYDFPIGTSANYELASVTLSSLVGPNYLTASFTASNPLSTLLPLLNVAVNGLLVKKLLNYGYWSITPDAQPSSGTYSVLLKEKGHTAPTGGRSYCILKRNNSLASWASIGTHDFSTQSEVAGVVTAVRSGLTGFSDFSVGYGEYLAFKNPVLISGTDGTVGAVYRFSDVSTDVDAWVEILQMDGATLDNIDNFVDGYDEAWQPFINVPGNRTSSINWKITFKGSGSNTDTLMSNVALTAVDVDGGSGMREFIESVYIYSYTLAPASVLTVTQSGAGYKVMGSTATINDIDTAHHEAMVQMNFRNVSAFTYRTGVAKTNSGWDTRQFSLYFNSFLNSGSTLPVNLLYFNALKGNNKVDLKWATGSEKENDFFTVERSTDGQIYEKILTVPGAGTTSSTHSYYASDKNPYHGTAYYRLKQTDFNGEFTYSDVRTVKYDDIKTDAAVEIRSVNPSLFNDHFTVNYTAKEAGPVLFRVTSINGQLIEEEARMMEEGNNYIEWNDEKNIPKGIYFVILTTATEKAVMKVVKQ